MHAIMASPHGTVENRSTLLVSATLVLFCAIGGMLLGVCTAQPHPYPMGFTIYAKSNCSSSNGHANDAPKPTLCHLRSFNVCMELMYYPSVCNSNRVNSTVKGNCGQQGTYNSTIVSLSPGNDDLPQTQWLVNFNTSNPMLPVLKDGIRCESDRCSVVVQTEVPKHGDNDNDKVVCETTITAQAWGWEWYYTMPEDPLSCDETSAISRCT